MPPRDQVDRRPGEYRGGQESEPTCHCGPHEHPDEEHVSWYNTALQNAHNHGAPHVLVIFAFVVFDPELNRFLIQSD